MNNLEEQAKEYLIKNGLVNRLVTVKAMVNFANSLKTELKYTEQDMDNAYDKGFKDGNQRDREL